VSLTDELRAARTWPLRRAIILAHDFRPARPRSGPVDVADAEIRAGTWGEVDACVALGLLTRAQFFAVRDAWKSRREG
jgi:hypothetical protein